MKLLKIVIRSVVMLLLISPMVLPFLSVFSLLEWLFNRPQDMDMWNWYLDLWRGKA